MNLTAWSIATTVRPVSDVEHTGTRTPDVASGQPEATRLDGSSARRI